MNKKFTFTCGICNTDFECESIHCGKTTRCISCNNFIVIPGEKVPSTAIFWMRVSALLIAVGFGLGIGLATLRVVYDNHQDSILPLLFLMLGIIGIGVLICSSSHRYRELNLILNPIIDYEVKVKVYLTDGRNEVFRFTAKTRQEYINLCEYINSYDYIKNAGIAPIHVVSREILSETNQNPKFDKLGINWFRMASGKDL